MEDRGLDKANITKIESETAQRKPRVMIVEDDELVNMLLQRVLEKDAQIEEGDYKSAQQATTALEQKKPADPKLDLLITDLGLEDGPTAGTRVIEMFRKKYPEASIIVLTGNKYKLDGLYTPEQEKALNFEVWTKPMSNAALIGKINTIKESINKIPQA